MSLRFDATLKDLAEGNPRGFVALFDRIPDVPVTMLNVDLSTVTSSADLVFGLGNPLQEILHFDCQASTAAYKQLDVLVYNSLLHRLYRVPVHSVLLLLCPQAKHSNQTGSVTYEARPGRSKMEFGYEIIRLWEVPVEGLLIGPVEMTPLAPLGRLPTGVATDDAMGDVIQRLVERIMREGGPDRARRLITSAYLLTGLRIPGPRVREFFLGVEAMRESSTYQLILDEGRIEAAREILLDLGSLRFGAPDENVRIAIGAIDDYPRLKRLGHEVLHAASWQDLLATP